MGAKELLQMQLTTAHESIEQTMSDVTADSAEYVPEGTALPVGALYAHMVVSEDFLVRGMLQKQTPLCMGDWKEKTGLSEPMPSFDKPEWGKLHAEWAKSVKVDLPALREYAKAVYGETDTYIQSLTDEDLGNDIDLSGFGLGMKPLAWGLSVFVIGHVNNLMGEIAAVKGFQGLKGYPF